MREKKTLILLLLLLLSISIGSTQKLLPIPVTSSTTMTLEFSTYIGAEGTDFAKDVALDSDGNIFVVGKVYANSTLFPTLNAYDDTLNGTSDAFICKLSPTGTLLYSTFLGGSGLETARSIAIDNTGAFYVSGTTSSSDFPVYSSGSMTYHGEIDTFVTKFTSSGSLEYSAIIGGAEYDEARGMGIDSSGACFITGKTRSTDFPMIMATDSTFLGYEEAFVVKLNPSGGFEFSTFLGGSDNDYGNSLAVDQAGHCYIGGYTTSSDFYVENAFQDTIAGDGSLSDIFVTKLDDRGAVLFSTFIGGSDYEKTFDICVSDEGYSYSTGYTFSDDFPTKDAYTSNKKPFSDAFVTCLSPIGEMVYSTFIGGSSYDVGLGIDVDDNGVCYVSGETVSADFPMMYSFNSSQSIPWSDAFLVKLDNSGNPTHTTFFGGSDGIETGESVAAISGEIGVQEDSCIIIGETKSTDLPIKNAAMINTDGNESDGYLSKFNFGNDPPGSGLPSPLPLPSPPTFWDKYGIYIIIGSVGVAVISGAISLILISKRRRKKPKTRKLSTRKPTKKPLVVLTISGKCPNCQSRIPDLTKLVDKNICPYCGEILRK